MASIRKRGRVFYYSFIDAEEKRRERKGCPDKRATEELALAAEVEVARIRAGLIDQRGLAYRDHAVSPLSDHIEAFKAHLEAKGSTTKHVGLTMQQLRRVFEAARIGRLADLSAEKVQAALKALRDEGLSLGTVNSHRTSARGFSKWCHDTCRTREHELRSVRGFNAKEDRRHDRRTLSLEELRRLIEIAHEGPTWRKMDGPARSLCYRLAVATGLRYSEIQSVRPESFDWTADPHTVSVEAAYTKNGETASIPLPADLAEDLRPFAEAVPFGEPRLPPHGRPRGDHASFRSLASRNPLPGRGRAGIRFPRSALPARHKRRRRRSLAPRRPEAHATLDA